MNVFNRVSDGRLLIPVLPALPLEQVKELIGKIITLSPNVVAAAVDVLLTKTKLSPTDLVVSIHQLQNKNNTKQCTQILEFILKRENIFNDKTMAVIFQQLVVLDPIPSLFMWTVCFFHLFHPIIIY